MNRQLNTFRIAGGAAALMLCAGLAACGGGGGGDSTASGSTTSTTTTTTTTSSSSISGTVSTSQYAAGSIQISIFDYITSARQQCGFSTLQENTLLDTASANHAQYMVDQYESTNTVAVTDTEVSTKTGYTGATYQTRAQYAGFPSDITVTGGSASYYTSPAITNSAYGIALAKSWQAGVYHTAIFTWPYTVIGVGEVSASYSGVELPFAAVSMGNVKTTGAAAEPIAFPCNGMTNVPYEAAGESPTPPGVGTTWGPAISITGQSTTDVIRMQSGSLVTGSTTITMDVLDSSTDTNDTLPAYEGVAYAPSALSPNTTYSYTVTYTINGTSKTVSNSFTTGS